MQVNYLLFTLGEIIMELITLWMAIGFLFAAYSVIANDSVQTLGTWIASNNDRFRIGRSCGPHLSVLLFGPYGMAGICMEEIFLTDD